MAYRATDDSSSQTPEERQAEAQRILGMGLEDMASRGELTKRENDFVTDIAGKMAQGVMPSTKTLWWLRDLKEKYLD
jgi:hypothetical protein